MKETVEYTYNIEVDDFYETDEYSSFKYNNEFFLLCLYKRNKEDIEDIISCSREVKEKKFISFDIMFNKENSAITQIDDKFYVLIKLPINYYEEIDLFEMIEYSNKFVLNENKKSMYKNNWKELWSAKTDYFEYQVSELGNGKYIVLDSFSYYIGLAENAIAMVDKANKFNEFGKNAEISLSHRRVYYPNYLLNYCNPISYIIDLYVRDFAEYIKSCFYENEDAYLELITFLKAKKLSNYSYQMLYARLIFPSLYFDLYEKAIIDKDQEEEIIKIVRRADEYEIFLKKAYNLINSYSKIENLTWLSS